MDFQQNYYLKHSKLKTESQQSKTKHHNKIKQKLRKEKEMLHNENFLLLEELKDCEMIQEHLTLQLQEKNSVLEEKELIEDERDSLSLDNTLLRLQLESGKKAEEMEIENDQLKKTVENLTSENTSLKSRVEKLTIGMSELREMVSVSRRICQV